MLPQTGTNLSDTNTSLVSENLRKLFQYQQRLSIQPPLKDDAFHNVIVDLQNQHTNQQLRELTVIKCLHFLKTYNQAQQGITDLGVAKYILRANELFGNQQRSSIQVDLADLAAYNMDLARFLVSCPKLGLSILNEALGRFVRELERNVGLIHPTIEARIAVQEGYNLPLAITTLKELKTEQINRMVAVRGVILQRFNKRPRLVQAYFQCRQCKTLIGPVDIKNNIFIQQKPIIDQQQLSLIVPKQCTNENCKSRHLALFSSQCVYEDVQRFIIQEKQEDVQPGFMPEKRDVIISGDLINQIQPGDNVQITGTYVML